MNFEAPLSRWRERILPEWLDYNGHMNVAWYTLIFDHGSDEFLTAIGLGLGYRNRTGKSTFAVEAHVTHHKEVGVDEEVLVTTQLLDYDAKRLHYFHVMSRAADGQKLATLEQLSLHVNLATRKVEPIPETSLSLLSDLWRSHSRMPIPEEKGSVLAIRSGVSLASRHPTDHA